MIAQNGEKEVWEMYIQKKLLILYILDILLKYTDEDHRLSQKEIQDILQKEYEMTVDRKAVKRNLLNLIEYGSDIEYREVSRTEIFRKKDSALVEDTVDFAEKGVSEDNLLWTDFYLKQKFTNEELRLLIDSLLFSRHVPNSQAKELITKLDSLLHTVPTHISDRQHPQHILPSYFSHLPSNFSLHKLPIRHFLFSECLPHNSSPDKKMMLHI